MKRFAFGIVIFGVFLIGACSATEAQDIKVLEIPTLIPSMTPVPPTAAQYVVTITIPAIFITPPSPTPTPAVVVITIEDTTKGDYLNITRTTDNLAYRLGPVAKGVYTVSPDNNFLVYCTNDGQVYASKIGWPYINPIGSVKYFSAIQKNTAPKFELKIFFNNGSYKVNVEEHRFGQNEIFVIPGNITN